MQLQQHAKSAKTSSKTNEKIIKLNRCVENAHLFFFYIYIYIYNRNSFSKEDLTAIECPVTGCENSTFNAPKYILSYLYPSLE